MGLAFQIKAPAAESAESADWEYRSTGPGVVWAHSFSNAAEVTQFRENGDLSYDPDGVLDGGAGYVDDPTTCSHDATDGALINGCLKITRPAGSSDGWNWYRPMSPLSSPGNGRDVDDPAANGTISLDANGAWDPGPGNAHDRTTDWTAGNYGPASTGTWEGDQFWLQYKLKVSSSRLTDGNFGGKVGYITRMNQTLTAQELVPSYDWDVESWRIYSGGSGTFRNELLPTQPSPPYGEKPKHYFDEWVEYLVHVVPGSESEGAQSDPSEGDSSPTYGNTRLNVWQRRAGAIGYTHIFSQNRVAIDYQNAYSKAWNAIIMSGYFNGQTYTVPFTQKFDEIIFSKLWIPPSRETTASDLETAANALSADSYSLDPITWNPANNDNDISWQCRTGFYDESRGEIQYMGKGQGGANARHFRYNEHSDSWTTTNSDAGGYLGHIYCAVSFDRTDNPGDYYYVQQYPNETPNACTTTVNRYNRDEDAWDQLPAAGFNVWQSSNTPNPGVVYHPNLLGPGLPGLFCWDTNQFSYFDFQNQSWTSVRTGIRYVDPYGGTSYNSWRLTQSIYVPGLDIAMYGSGDTGFVGGNPQCLVIEAGSGGDQNHSTYDMPEQVCSDDYTTGTYDMILDPRDPTLSTIMLLEKNGGTVYTCSDPTQGLSGWTQESFTHPFWNNNPYRSTVTNQRHSWTACSIPKYGVILGMGSYGDGGGSVLWKPGT